MATQTLKMYNPATGQLEEFTVDSSINWDVPRDLFPEGLPYETKDGDDHSCGDKIRWVDNGIGFRYFYCRTCKVEIS